MFAFIVRRSFYTIPIFIGIALITFLLFNVAGGDPAQMILGKHVSASALAEMRAQLGLDRPLYIQFFDQLKSMVTFDFGRSYATKQEIWTMITRAAPVSFSLALPVFLITLMISVSISLFVAFWRGTWIDKSIICVCVMGISTPILSYILFGQYVLAYRADMFPISGYGDTFISIAFHLMLPTIILVSVSLGGEVRFYRTVMLDEINQDYVRTARAKGLSEKRVMFKHVLKNAMIPIITRVVIVIPFLIVGSLLIENFFAIPGMGSMMIDAINSSDFPVVRALVTIFSILYIVFNLLTDICYAIVDPRISVR